MCSCVKTVHYCIYGWPPQGIQVLDMSNSGVFKLKTIVTKRVNTYRKDLQPSIPIMPWLLETLQVFLILWYGLWYARSMSTIACISTQMVELFVYTKGRKFMTLELHTSSLQQLSRTSISGFINASIYTNISFVTIQCTFRWNLWSFKKSEWIVLKGLLFLCWAFYIDKGPWDTKSMASC